MPNIAAQLEQRLRTKEATVAIMGLGYVGLPLAMAFADAGLRVIGYDVNARVVEGLNRGESHVEDVPSSQLQANLDRFRATTDGEDLREADVMIICVPTPLRKTREPDISFVLAATEIAASVLKAGQLVVLESTTYPGTTEEVLRPRFEKNGFRVGEDYFLAFSPERIDPGNKVYTLSNTPKVVGGVTPACKRVATALYEQITSKVVPVSSPTVAEVVKLLENTFRAVNIGLANEIAILCNRMGLNVWEIIKAAATKPYGFMAFYPGPGIGGHCIPIDPLYLSWRARLFNFTTRFIELADQVNSSMQEYVVRRVADALNDHSKPLRGSKILVLGVAYKKDISDVRESPALNTIELLQAKGGKVFFHDPHVPTIKLETGEELTSVEFTPEKAGDYDCVVIITDHSAYDWPEIVRHAQLVVDTRNATEGIVSDNVRLL